MDLSVSQVQFFETSYHSLFIHYPQFMLSNTTQKPLYSFELTLMVFFVHVSVAWTAGGPLTEKNEQKNRKNVENWEKMENIGKKLRRDKIGNGKVLLPCPL